MIYSTKILTDNSPIYPMTPTPVKKQSARKSLCIFMNILDVKNKSAICRFGYTKSKRKVKKSGTAVWAKKTKRKVKNQP